MDCIFCKIVNGEMPSSRVYEDEDILAFLSIAPINRGHVLIIPKKHCEGLLDADDKILEKMLVRAKQIARAMMEATGAGGFNLKQNNGKAADQAVPHMHLHIMPRFENDGYADWEGGSYEEGEMEEWAEKIREKII